MNHPESKVVLSTLITRTDSETLTEKVAHFNKHFLDICKSKKYDIIDNSNINSSCLSFKGLHLSHRGDAHFAMILKQRTQGFKIRSGRSERSQDCNLDNSKVNSHHTNKFIDRKKGSLICSLSIVLLLKHKDEIELLVINNNIDILVVNETRPEPDTNFRI